MQNRELSDGSVKASSQEMSPTIISSNGHDFFSLPDSTIMRPNGTPKPLNDNGDLWWSVLGGGGGTYGVITEFKVKLHEAPAGGFINLFLNFNVFKHGPCAGAAVEVSSHLYSVEFFSEKSPKIYQKCAPSTTL